VNWSKDDVPPLRRASIGRNSSQGYLMAQRALGQKKSRTGGSGLGRGPSLTAKSRINRAPGGGGTYLETLSYQDSRCGGLGGGSLYQSETLFVLSFGERPISGTILHDRPDRTFQTV
jgi:hypothetical protein